MQRGAFPTDRYVAAGIGEVKLVDELDTDAGLVIWSHVDYRSGELADLPAVTAACRDAGVPLIWDLSHSAGAVPCDLAAAGAELAVGCTYKYLNSGPGGTGFLHVADESLQTPIQGLVRPARPVRHGARVRPAAGRRALPRRDALPARARVRRGGRAHHRGGGHRRDPREVRGAD